MKTEARRLNSLFLSDGYTIRHGWHAVIGSARWGWALYSSAGDCTYLARYADAAIETLDDLHMLVDTL